MNKLISINQFARKHKVTRQYIHQLIKAGRLDAVVTRFRYEINPNSKIKKVKRGRPKKVTVNLKTLEVKEN